MLPKARGIDVSHHQTDRGPIRWEEVAGAGYSFCWVKLSQGVTGRDKAREVSWKGARAAGLLVGGYHFFNPERDGRAQAESFCACHRDLGGATLPPALDLEPDPAHPITVSAATLLERAKDFLLEVERSTGWRPVVYTYPSFASQYGLGAALGGWGLWLAHYGVVTPTVPRGWSSWRAWQQTDKGRCPGVTGDVDLNLFAGGLPDLKDWAASSLRVRT